MQFDNKIPISVEHRTKLNLPSDHVSTGMFMLLQPMWYRHTLRTEKLNCSFTSVVRPNPLVVPTFGRIRQNLRHFFVPYRLIFPNWEEFISDVIANNVDRSSQVSTVPNFEAFELYNLFFGNFGLSETVTSPTSNPMNYDFQLKNNTFVRLSRLGRYFYKVLYSLGYDIIGSTKNVKFNALALLAYARVYCDWYANSAYLNDATYLKLQRYFKFNDPSSSLKLTASDIYSILVFIRPAIYNTNPYFEDAWDNPVSPNDGNYSQLAFADPTSTKGTYVTTNGNNGWHTPEMFQSTSSSTSIGTKYLHDALQKLSAYQKRHALSGAHAIDRVLSEYGIQTDYLRLNRSIYVGVSSQDVDINSIYATANGENSNGESVVGDYAGAGIGRGASNIQFQTDEEGIFLTVSTIQPSGGYFQGYDRNNRLLTKEQFFQPAFDSLGVQSIEKGEVYVSRNMNFDSSDDGDTYVDHFGFTARYGEKKRSINRVSGDFSFPSVLQGGDAWHLMRQFDDDYFSGDLDNVVHSQDFARGTDAEQFLRLFTYTRYTIDPFNLFLHVDCVSYAPCSSLSDSFDWQLETERVTVNSNGSKVN